MKNRKLLDVILIILSVSAAILTATPNAVLMRFGTGYGTLYKYVSGFSMLPVGYGIWGAMVAGVGSVVLTLLGVIDLIKASESLRKWMFGIAIVALIMRLSLLCFGSMTFIGFVISVLLASKVVLLYYMKDSN